MLSRITGAAAAPAIAVVPPVAVPPRPSRRGTSQGASQGCRQRSVVPSLWTSVRNFTPDLRIARIAACAERQTQHCAPTGNSG